MHQLNFVGWLDDVVFEVQLNMSYGNGTLHYENLPIQYTDNFFSIKN